MPITLTQTEVINRFNQIHANKYDYSKVIYTKIHEKVKIICPIHGEFEQRPVDHMNGQNCPSCAQVSRNTIQTSDLLNFIHKANKKHNFKYNYNKTLYVKSSQKVVIICPEHGEFTKTPNKHLMGQGCPKCSNSYRRTQEDFINDSINVHGNLYDYSKAFYKNVDEKLIIICPIHGEFIQTPYHHIKKKSGCPSCSNYGFKYTEEAFLYYIKISLNDKILYKIGITNRSIEERFSVVELKNIEVLKIKKFKTGYEAFNIEQSIIKENKSHLYNGEPILVSNGNTELFTKDITLMVEQYF